MSEQQLKIAYYVTGHGLGHATRVIEISHHLLRNGHKVTINTGAPHAFFQQQLKYQGLSMRSLLLDSGAFQHDAFTVDMKRSLEEYQRIAQNGRNEKLSAESTWLAENSIDLVVSDVVPLACAAAHLAHVPSVCVTNFSWDFIYSDYLTQVGSGFRSLIWQIAEDYAKADLCLRLPGHCPMPAFREILDVPLVARRAQKTATQVKEELGFLEKKKVVLFMYGGQPAGNWSMKAESVPDGWVCILCSNGKLPGDRPLPENFILADKDVYTPDLVNAADCVLGKIGYGAVSEALVHGTPFVFTRRDFFNEEPFLRKLLEVNGLAVEMRRRDFLEGNWKAFISKAATLQSCFKQQQNGSEVVASLLEEIALEKKAESDTPRRSSAANSLALQRTTTSLGSTRLKDAVVYGYIMQRHAKRENVEIPEWYADQLNNSPVASPAKASPAKQLPENVEIFGGNTLAVSENEDTLRFVGTLAHLASSCLENNSAEMKAAQGLFRPNHAIHIARAPGRLDVMGGIADYSGSLVLEMPVAEACHVAAQTHPPGEQPDLWQHIKDRHEASNKKKTAVIRIVSLGADKTNRGATFDIDLCELCPDGQPIPYREARQLLKEDPSRSWAAYVIGCMIVLMHEEKAEFNEGLSLLINSEVPDGKGVSSSAALEVASMSAIASAFGIVLQPSHLASLCQKVENLVVGAPCGVMDQMAVTLGQKDSLMALRCQPAEILPSCVIPTGIRFWAVDSGVRHSVGGNDYGSVRAAAFMGLKIISSMAEQRRAKGGSHRSRRPDSQSPKLASLNNPPKAGDGYLTNIPPSLFRQFFEPELPETMRGSEFLEKYGEHWDSATSVEADQEYPVAQATQHAIQENFRVHAFRAVMTSQEPDFPSLLAEIMYQSHASYSRCGLGSDATDRLVDLARQHTAQAIADGSVPAIFGAKITGGGSGGTVCFIARDDLEGEKALKSITETYSQETGGFEPFVFRGSSMGASDFGILQIRLLHKA